MQFDYFFMESSTGCQYDWLAVYDGEDEDAPMITMMCGSQTVSRSYSIPITDTCKLFPLFRVDMLWIKGV